MTEEQAIAVANVSRRAYQIAPEMKFLSAEQAIVMHRPTPEAVPADRVAWIVLLSSSFGFVRVLVDDASGQILDVEKSR